MLRPFVANSDLKSKKSLIKCNNHVKTKYYLGNPNNCIWVSQCLKKSSAGVHGSYCFQDRNENDEMCRLRTNSTHGRYLLPEEESQFSINLGTGISESELICPSSDGDLLLTRSCLCLSTSASPPVFDRTRSSCVSDRGRVE